MCRSVSCSSSRQLRCEDHQENMFAIIKDVDRLPSLPQPAAAQIKLSLEWQRYDRDTVWRPQRLHGDTPHARPDLWQKLLVLLVKRKQPFIVKMDFVNLLSWENKLLTRDNEMIVCRSETAEWKKIVATMAALGFRSLVQNLLFFPFFKFVSWDVGLRFPVSHWGESLLWGSSWAPRSFLTVKRFLGVLPLFRLWWQKVLYKNCQSGAG